MARKEISTPLDLKNLDNHNYNYEELYSLIDETDRRISEDMWEEIKDANTMKMLEPVQTAADLPSEAPDKSFITVIDEQRVYTYFRGEWQPFNQIDLDPFEPFKSELQTMIDNHEAKAQQLLSDMQTEHDNAVTEITNLTNDFNTDYQSKMDAFTSDYQDKSDQLQADYNSYSEQIDTNTTNSLSSIETNTTDSLNSIDTNTTSSLSDIDTAKNDALTELENFQNTDTSNWQKYKLSNDDGSFPFHNIEGDLDAYHALAPGNYYTAEVPIENMGQTSSSGFTKVEERSGSDVKRITFRPYNSDQVFIKIFYKTWGEWEPANGSKIVLFEGSAKSTGDIINLSTSYENFTELRVKLNRTGGNEIFNYDAESGVGISINYSNIFNDNSEGKLYEMVLNKKSPTELEITSQRSITFNGTETDDSGITILKIWGVI